MQTGYNHYIRTNEARDDLPGFSNPPEKIQDGCQEIIIPGQKGVHLYVNTNERWGVVICVKCGKVIDATQTQRGPDDICPIG